MKVTAPLGFPVGAAPIARSEPSRTELLRPESSRPEQSSESSDSAPEADRVTNAQFSTILALLAGNGPRVRAELLKQIPANGVALIDRLLDGVVTGENSEQPASDNAKASTNATVDAVRYGMLTDLSNGALAAAATAAAAMPATTQPATATETGDTAKAVEGTKGRTRGTNNSDDTGNRRQAALAGALRAAQNGQAPDDVLSRIAERRGASLEELMALGDLKGADARSALDALLARAGTPEGAAIADAAAGSAAAAAHAAAFAAARSASAADVATPIKDVEALVPDFRARLDRVIERMKAEYGHDVQIVETIRSPERQEKLFAQGRTEAGPVVTWTRDSAHLRGEAADVVIDGSWKNAEGFARLQRIAREEGLRTLGLRDPGHLEFKKDGLQDDAAERMIAKPAPSQTVSGVARVANIAGVAGVARVASQGVHIEAPSEPKARGIANSSASLTGLAQASPRAGGAADGASAGSSGSSDSRGEGSRENGRDIRRASARSDEGSAFGGQGAFTPNTPMASSSERVAAPMRVDSAERVADMQDMRDASPARALSQLTLEVDGPGGDAQRITVDMRGNSVGTHIATDAASAERMRSRVGELQGALEAHGFEADAVRISAPARTLDAAEQVKQAASASERDAIRLAGAGGSSAGDGAASQGQRERSTAARDWDKQGDAREARDGKRQGSGQQNRRGPNYEEL